MESRRLANRASMPTVAKWVDEMQAEFGKVLVVHAQENGIEFGKRQPDGVVPNLEMVRVREEARLKPPRNKKSVPAYVRHVGN